jgi:hypothetical protein
MHALAEDELVQNVAQTASGQVMSIQNGQLAVLDTFSYPLNINITLLDPSGNSSAWPPSLSQKFTPLTLGY